MLFLLPAVYTIYYPQHTYKVHLMHLSYYMQYLDGFTFNM